MTPDTFVEFLGQQRGSAILRCDDQELADSSQDADALRRIAAASRGTDASARYLFLGDATGLVPEFADRKSFETREDTRTRPVWDTVWSLLAVLSVLGLEWLLRKRARLI